MHTENRRPTAAGPADFEIPAGRRFSAKEGNRVAGLAASLRAAQWPRIWLETLVELGGT